jgi:hypothetical protein
MRSGNDFEITQRGNEGRPSLCGVCAYLDVATHHSPIVYLGLKVFREKELACARKASTLTRRSSRYPYSHVLNLMLSLTASFPPRQFNCEELS